MEVVLGWSRSQPFERSSIHTEIVAVSRIAFGRNPFDLQYLAKLSDASIYDSEGVAANFGDHMREARSGK